MKHIYIAILLVTLFSCNEKEPGFIGLFNKQVNVHASIYDAIQPDSLGSPKQLLAIGDYVIFSEPSLPQLMMAYNTVTGKVHRLLPKGQGANEALSIQEFGLYRGGNTFYVKDTYLNTLFLFEVSEQGVQFLQIDKETPEQNISSLAYDDKRDLMFFLTQFEEKHFTFRQEHEFHSFADQVEIENLSPIHVSTLLYGRCLCNPIENRLAWFSDFGDVMEVYDYTDLNRIKLVTSKVLLLPTFGATPESGGAVSMRPTTKIGIASVTSDTHAIYALHNEHTLMDVLQLQNRNDIFFSNKILVFDWNGNPLRIINIDHEVKYITYSAKEQALLGIGYDKDSNYVVYRIPV
ncbi:MAG: TolB-like 6-bladed beta-propeller domain-containing protein [Prevotellaceae bacterium]|nr:TolB-like 6-bladed beta-propeller domain-containing protein [Prevotellaceae bacterium]